MVNIERWEAISDERKRELLDRSEADISSVRGAVEEIISAVRHEGDKALRRFTADFDGVDLGDLPLAVSREERRRAADMVPEELKQAIAYSVENVRRFHRGQKPEGMLWHEIRPGVLAGERALPLDSAGLYIPRGRGSFPSMLYMMAVPAQIAGVHRIAMVTPPGPDGGVDPACLYAAELCGVHEIYRVGGSQALAALAYGTESIEPVVKFMGPGSMYVAAAKRILAEKVDVGLPAGPSESIILADDSADPVKIALDFLIEAEHGSDSSALLITPDMNLAQEAAREIESRLEGLPQPRRQFVQDVLQGYGGIIVTEDFNTAAEVVNRFAPEHLQIQCREPFDSLPLIRNAGEILLGENTPFSLANYSAGPNAVLPTGGKARSYSAVSVRDFMKYSSVIHCTAKGYEQLAAPAAVLADYEGFFCHAQALKGRPDSADAPSGAIRRK